MRKLIYLAKLLVVIGFILSVTANAGLELPNGINMNVSVMPIKGALYFNTDFFGDLEIYNYTYTFELLGADKESRPEKMLLQFRNESASNWTHGIEIDNLNQDSVVIKEVDLSKVLGEYLGEVEYRVIDGNNETPDNVLYSSKGPEIVVNFKDESANKIDEDLYNYSVFVRSSISPLDIYIFYSDADEPNNINWNRYSEVQTCRNENWSRLSWDDAPWFHRLEFQAAINEK